MQLSDTGQRLVQWFKGHQHAIDWGLMLLDLVAIWDDLIDKDKPVSNSQINEAFCNALLWMPTNPFYRHNQETLHPLLITAYRNWKLATQIEQNDTSTDHDHMIAYILRSSYIDVLVACAALLSGQEWADQVARDARAFFHNDSLAQYQTDLINEKKARLWVAAEVQK